MSHRISTKMSQLVSHFETDLLSLISTPPPPQLGMLLGVVYCHSSRQLFLIIKWPKLLSAQTVAARNTPAGNKKKTNSRKPGGHGTGSHSTVYIVQYTVRTCTASSFKIVIIFSFSILFSGIELSFKGSWVFCGLQSTK